VSDDAHPIDLRIACQITGSGSTEVQKILAGVLHLDASGAFAGRFRVGVGQLFVNGSMPNTTIVLAGANPDTAVAEATVRSCARTVLRRP
jgi:hypothetical protein